MSISTDETIHWKGRDYYGAKELGVFKKKYAFAADPTEIHEGFAVSLFTTPISDDGCRGSYHAFPPISSQSYRKSHPTQAGFALDQDGIAIFCDHGVSHHIRCSPFIASQLAEECVEWGLPDMTARKR